MDISPYQLMQSAVDIVADSPHPDNKVAATLVCGDFSVSQTNFWPGSIEQNFDHATRIGSSSGTIHAETACLLEAPKTDGASVFITDPPCPNCMKNLAEAGIQELYIDHKGFDKDWLQRNEDHFDHMSMKIAEHAGIAVYEIFRKDEKVIPILETPAAFEPDIERPLRLLPEENVSAESFKKHIEDAEHYYMRRSYAIAFAHSNTEHFILSAEPHPTIGYTTETLEEPDGKYSFFLEPINRLLMGAAKNGLTIDPAYLYSSRVPTSREFVNMVGAGLTRICIGDIQDCRDDYGLIALKQLQGAGILNIQ